MAPSPRVNMSGNMVPILAVDIIVIMELGRAALTTGTMEREKEVYITVSTEQEEVAPIIATMELVQEVDIIGTMEQKLEAVITGITEQGQAVDIITSMQLMDQNIPYQVIIAVTN